MNDPKSRAVDPLSPINLSALYIRSGLDCQWDARLVESLQCGHHTEMRRRRLPRLKITRHVYVLVKNHSDGNTPSTIGTLRNAQTSAWFLSGPSLLSQNLAMLSLFFHNVSVIGPQSKK